MAEQRIVSLLPSATEIVCALGLADRLLGVSHECDFPSDIAGRPVLTEAKIEATGTSAAIDSAVRALVRDGLGVYRIHTDLLRALQPDLIVTQDQCDVCAVPFAEVEAATRQTLGTAAQIVSLRPVRLEDIFTDIERVAVATRRQDVGAQVVARGRERLDAIRRRLQRARSRPRVACIEWLDPLMAAGNWIPELVTLAGGIDGLAEAGAHSKVITWEDLAAYQPEVIVLMPCGFKLEQTQRELARLTSHPLWRELPAVRNQRVYATDGNAYFNRPGPRIVDSAELLAGLVQPGFCADRIPEGSYSRVI
jgi:iron complex transport system substrate-binding protein